MPTFEQTKEVLHHCQRFHRKVGAYYSQLKDHSNSARVQLFLDYLVDHEEKVATALERYEETAPPRVLNTWLQTVTVTESLPIFDRIEIDEDMSVDEILDIGLHFDNVLRECYRVVRDNAEFGDVREAFQNLLEFEEQEKQTLVRVAQSTADV